MPIGKGLTVNCHLPPGVRVITPPRTSYADRFQFTIMANNDDAIDTTVAHLQGILRTIERGRRDNSSTMR